MGSYNTVDGDRVAKYQRDKQSLQKVLDEMPGRVCLVLDRWTSSQGIDQVLVGAQFLDSHWQMRRKLLNVIRVLDGDSDTALSRSVAACLSQWRLHGKLYSVTINETDLTHAAVANLRNFLFRPANADHVLVLHCLARLLSSIVKDALVSVQGIVNKVRDSVQYVKDNYFMELNQQHLSIDNPTQWNMTYEMLLAASKLKEVFSNYKGAPWLEEDWKQIETLCTYLKPLFDTANLLTKSTAPTSNTFFHGAWQIQMELSRAAAREDPFVSNLTRPMLGKFINYWNTSCLMLAVAVVMDPRFKMKLVEWSFVKMYGDEVGREWVTMVDDCIHDIFPDYLALTPANVEEANAQSSIKLDEENSNGLGLSDFDADMALSQQSKSELDQYLEGSLVPREPGFDVVVWWKVNRTKYPTLSKMACDILSTPVCIVRVGSVFDTERKDMDSCIVDA